MPLTYKIPSYQSIFDALTTIEVPLDSIVNSLLVSDLDLDSDLSGEDLIYELTEISKPKGGQVAVFDTPLTSSYTTNSTQNLFDVTLMTLGDLNKIVLLVSSNSIFNNINDYPDGVKAVIYNNSDITDSGFKLALKKANINIVTGVVEEASLIGELLQEDLFDLLQEDGFQILLS
jgi:hypothetical protein